MEKMQVMSAWVYIIHSALDTFFKFYRGTEVSANTD